MSTCFVIMPISTPIEYVPHYNGDPDHFGHVLTYLFEPALQRAGYRTIRPSVLNSEIIQAEIIRNLETADLVLCDISTWNANVFFELGIRVALDRPVALVKDSNTSTIPFDNALVSCHTYDSSMMPWCLDSEIEKLAQFVRSAGAQDRNALWRYFGITQRARIPAAEDDPMQEKIDLLLAQVGSLSSSKRSDLSSPFNLLFARQEELLGAYITDALGEKGRVTGWNRVGNRIDFLVSRGSDQGGLPELNDIQRFALAEFAMSHGLSIQLFDDESNEPIFWVSGDRSFKPQTRS